MFYRPFGNFTELNRTVTCMVLKAKALAHCQDEFRGPRSDYVRQVELWTQVRGEPQTVEIKEKINGVIGWFGCQWIRHGGPVPWSPGSSYLTCFDYVLWGYLKNLVYVTPLDSDENRIARISEAAAHVREIPDIFQRVRTTDAGGCNF
ncbi:uncharacterized protein TNCV_5019291 [Trichonephila clavipes]|nr:uncharacterized protein TNCV_5019291 [Trichonephila clavipes]